jgi:membrane protein implicated in regulation of membrane protease activity
MEGLAAVYADHPFWVWMALAAALLAIEALLGTEWLLWPAASAAAVAFLALLRLPIGAVGELAAFAALTLLTTFFARKLLRRVQPPGEDLNDRNARLIGRTAEVVVPFRDGRGRVFVDGAEWPAELEGDLGTGARVKVVGVGGASLKVSY